MPRFTYHGFRFVRVTGLDILTADMIEMHHFHSDNAQRSNATFKSTVLTTLQAMAVGAQSSNQMTVQTDCDQRDERLGWMVHSSQLRSFFHARILLTCSHAHILWDVVVGYLCVCACARACVYVRACVRVCLHVFA